MKVANPDIPTHIVEGNASPKSIFDSPEYKAALKKMYAPGHLSITPPVFSLVVGFLIVIGWNADLENYSTPESGFGYWIGITGGVAMLLLLLYPLRKRVHGMRNWGPVRIWFKTHMTLGIIGPLMILYHCNFSLGAINSNVSLVAMGFVVASGIIGRYIYGKIHYGLYGNRFNLEELKVDKMITDSVIKRVFEIAPDLKTKLKDFETAALQNSNNLLSSFFRFFFLGSKAHLTYFGVQLTLSRSISHLAEESGWSKKEEKKYKKEVRNYIGAHLTTVVRIVQYGFFERLFSIWHVLHVPLFVMLLVTGIYHVLAVHMY